MRTEFVVSGMDCAEEVALLRGALEPLPGVGELGFDLLRRRLSVQHDPGRIDAEALCRAIDATGMRAEALAPDGPPPAPVPSGFRRRHLALTGATGLVAAGLVLHLAQAGPAAALGGHEPPIEARLCYLLAAVLGIVPLLPRAAAAARRLRPDMYLLMVVAIAGALVLGEWLEAATVAVLFELSLLLEAASVGRARRAVEALLDLTPPEAVRLAAAEGDATGRREQRVPAGAVRAGDRLLVRPGERVPVDGTVRAGHSELDQSALTGEPLPVDRGPGEPVLAGSINGSGAIEVEASGGAADSTLARVARLVEQAAARRSPTERFVERFARVYTPAVLVLAAAFALLPPLLGGREVLASVYDALVLLVIACPCALVISTPVSMAAALAAAARHGVLVKGAAFLEVAARPGCLALDKTGTLTAGRARLVEVVPLEGHDPQRLLGLAAAVESHGRHPLARAIVAAARERGLSLPGTRDARELPGRGAEAVIDGEHLWLGSHRLLEERGQETPEMHRRIEQLESAGHTVVVVGREHHVCGLLVLGDETRPEAVAALMALRSLDVGPLVLLTGDNAGTARALAERLGLDEVHAELLPQDKLAVVEELAARHGRAVMVGDGVNDAPALAGASLGIAVGGAGHDVALETADIVLLAPDLLRLPWLVAHARRTLATVRFNIGLSLLVKAAFLALAATGEATLWSAIAADMGVSLLVVLNALRLLVPARR